MKKLFFVLLMFPLLIPPLYGATELPLGFQEDLIVYGLRQPVLVEYAPDGRLFILEKQGRIRIFKDGQLLKKPFLKVKVDSLFERGLVGLAFDPDFENNQYVYVYRTTAGSNPKNVLERYTAKGDVVDTATRMVLLDGINSDSGIHNAGGLRFGQDGTLYVSTGDGGLDSDLAQDLSSLNGKILRMNPDGSIPADNPFVNQPGARPEIWCYGLRNPWRFAIHPKNGMMVIGDVGGNDYEEINIGYPGANYGWPLVEGPSDNPQFTNPVFTYDHQEGGAAVIIGGYYAAKKFPSKYRNRFFFVDYGRKFLKMIKISSSGVVKNVQDLANGLTTPVHITEAPDGSLVYCNISTGEVRRIRFVGGNNRPPVVESGVTRRSGAVPLTVRFNSNGTLDPDGDAVAYHWDFGNGQTSDLPSPTVTYSKKGTFFAVLRVTDSRGATGDARPIKMSVGNEAPTAIILTPSPGTVIHPGDTIQFKGKGMDKEDGPLPSDSLGWSAKLHHNEHTHPAFGGVKGNSGSFTIPLADHGEGVLFYRLKLSVKDSEGLKGSATVDLPLE